MKTRNRYFSLTLDHDYQGLLENLIVRGTHVVNSNAVRLELASLSEDKLGNSLNLGVTSAQSRGNLSCSSLHLINDSSCTADKDLLINDLKCLPPIEVSLKYTKRNSEFEFETVSSIKSQESHPNERYLTVSPPQSTTCKQSVYEGSLLSSNLLKEYLAEVTSRRPCCGLEDLDIIIDACSPRNSQEADLNLPKIPLLPTSETYTHYPYSLSTLMPIPSIPHLLSTASSQHWQDVYSSAKHHKITKKLNAGLNHLSPKCGPPLSDLHFGVQAKELSEALLQLDKQMSQSRLNCLTSCRPDIKSYYDEDGSRKHSKSNYGSSFNILHFYEGLKDSSTYALHKQGLKNLRPTSSVECFLRLTPSTLLRSKEHSVFSLAQSQPTEGSDTNLSQSRSAYFYLDPDSTAHRIRRHEDNLLAPTSF